MAEPPSLMQGAPRRRLGRKNRSAKCKPHPGTHRVLCPPKKIRTEEKEKAPRRLNGEGASSGNSRQLQSPAAPSPQSFMAALGLGALPLCPLPPPRRLLGAISPSLQARPSLLCLCFLLSAGAAQAAGASYAATRSASPSPAARRRRLGRRQATADKEKREKERRGTVSAGRATLAGPLRERRTGR